MLRTFRKLDKRLDISVRWLGLYPVLSGAYAWLLKSAPWLQHANWAEAILLGIGASLATLLAVAVTLALYRVYKPLPGSAVGLNNGPELPLSNGPESGGLSEFLLADAAREEQQEAALAEEIARQDRIVKVQAKINEGLCDDVRDTGRKVERLIADYTVLAGQQHDLEGAQANFRANVAKRFDDLQWSLQSIYRRERLRELAVRLTDEADEMSARITMGLRFDGQDWDEWLRQESAWNAQMYDWSQLAAPYMPKVLAYVETINREHYEGDWTFQDSDFPSALAVHKYKEFRVRLLNWNNLREKVMNCVYNVAFEGFSSPGPKDA